MTHPFMDGIQVPLQLIYIWHSPCNLLSTFIFNIILYFQYGIIFHWFIIQLSNYWEYPDTDITLVSEPTLPRASVESWSPACGQNDQGFLEFRSLTSQWLLAILIQIFSGKNWFLTKNWPLAIWISLKY